MEESTHEEFLANFQSLRDGVVAHLSTPLVDKPFHAYTTLARANDAIQRVELMRRKNFVRRQPFGIIIAGPPGSGKTYGLQRLCTDLYKLDHDECRISDTVILNEGDQFQSEFQTHHKIVIFDDLGATRAEFGGDPFRKIIDFINNVPKTALNPHLDLKGVVWIEPEIVGATTNLGIPFRRIQQTNTDSIMCPDAINRRFKLKLWQHGYDEFYIVPDNGDPGILEGKLISISGLKPLNYQQVFEIAKLAYLDHQREQVDFLKITSTIHSESAMLNYTAIILFQQALRLWVSSLSQKDIPAAMGGISLKRFLFIDLQNIKMDARNEIFSDMYNKGMSITEVQEATKKIERSLRGTVSAGYLSTGILEDDITPTLHRVIDILVPAVLRVVKLDSCYDLISFLLSFVFGKVISNNREVIEEKWEKYSSSTFSRSNFRWLLGRCKASILAKYHSWFYKKAESRKDRTCFRRELRIISSNKTKMLYDYRLPDHDYWRVNNRVKKREMEPYEQFCVLGCRRGREISMFESSQMREGLMFKGKFSFIYIKEDDTIYIVFPETYKPWEYPSQFIDVFSKKCNIYCIFHDPDHVDRRKVVPLTGNDFSRFYRHFDILCHYPDVCKSFAHSRDVDNHLTFYGCIRTTEEGPIRPKAIKTLGNPFEES